MMDFAGRRQWRWRTVRKYCKLKLGPFLDPFLGPFLDPFAMENSTEVLQIEMAAFSVLFSIEKTAISMEIRSKCQLVLEISIANAEIVENYLKNC